MTPRLREGAATARASRAAPPRDDAVSPVVGMILVLAISIVGIAAILYWGLPAIDEMKANVEYRSVEAQFGELDATIRELVAGTTEKTARRFQPSINRGEFRVVNNSEPWLFAMEKYNATNYNNLTWSGFPDGDHHFTITNRGNDLPDAFVQAYVVSGTSVLTQLGVSQNPGSATQMVNIGTWNNGTSQQFYLWVKDANPQQKRGLDSAVFKIQVYAKSTLVAEAYYTNTSRIEYNLDAVTSKSIIYNNGGIIGVSSGSAVMENTPPVPPVTNTSGVPRFFGRMVTLNGTAGFSGEDRFDLLISLYSTTTLASYDCAMANGSDCAYSTKIYVLGSQQDAWNAYLTRTGIGYGLKAQSDNGVAFLEERQWRMSYTLLGSNLRMVG